MNTEEIHGLSAATVKDKQRQQGSNELPDNEKRNFLKIFLGTVTEPMIFLLVSVVAVYFFLGDRTEALVLAFSVIVVVAIDLFQDLRSEHALEALRNMASPHCTVIREGRHEAIPSRELVVGDVVLVAEGERVPADARLLSAQNVQIDESILTGESIPVDKKAQTGRNEPESLVFSGTVVVKGHGIAEVTAIGAATAMGKIGLSLSSIKQEKTRLQKETDAVVKKVALVAISLSVILALLFLVMRGKLLEGLLAGLTLAIAILPEEFPVVFTVFMALGAWRLARSNVLTRRSQAIEALGSASVLCVDKTGTLTENRMAVAAVTGPGGKELTKDQALYKQIVDYGTLASQIHPFDPMEEAFLDAVKATHKDIGELYGGGKIIKEYPLENGSLSVAHVWAGKNKKPKTVALKGAPETVFALCHLSKEHAAGLEADVKRYASEGLRVLGVAKARPLEVLPADRSAFAFEFLGLVALADPVRKEAAAAVKLCHGAGIRVIMMTGDYEETARRIGHEVGLETDAPIRGEAFRAMSAAEQTRAIKTATIFSRVLPADKLTIVNALKSNGEVVAMTGDGVNDAPALKAAHIGIAMGKRGTDVAREASSIILLDDNFVSIVHGIRLGRRIFTNLQKAIAYVIAVHVPIAALSMLPVVFNWPIMLFPVHIVFLEFIIDPSSTLVFENEPEETDAMRRPPRRLGAPLFSKPMVLRSLTEGFLLAIILVTTYGVLLANGWDEWHARSVVFLMTVLTNIFLIATISGRRAVFSAFRTKAVSPLLLVILLACVALAVIYTVPFMQRLFLITSLEPLEAGLAVGLSLVAAYLIVPLKRSFDRVFPKYEGRTRQ